MSHHEFQAETKQLLHLMIHSLYTEREIFLRELISNASDACDKLRFESLTQTDLMKGDDRLRIDVTADKDAGTITLTDTGIGLTQDEAVRHLGTIAKSGTREYVQKLGQDKAADLSGLIGQFGVGFYASFMVADKVTVESRSARASSDEGVRWESTGDGAFEVEPICRPQRGTTITLHLKEDAKEFLDLWRLKSLIKKYSDFITYPVFLPKDDKKKEVEQVNEGKALWTKPKDQITAEQYTWFYRSACKMYDDPATHVHFTVEGTQSFTALLYIPSQKPMDLFDRQHRGLSLYVRRVFIMDDCTELLPEWLRFVRGVVDSDDLPLNVGREMLQNEATVKRLRKVLVKRVLDHLEKLADSAEEADRKTFATVDEQFGPILREGLAMDFEHKERLAKLVRYRSTWTETQPKPEGVNEAYGLRTSLSDYVKRMPKEQEAIYFITAASLIAAKASPHLEGYIKKGYEVLICTDPVDEWVTGHAGEFEGKKWVGVAKGADDLADKETKKALEKQAKEMKGFLGFAKESLGKGIKEVRLGARLTDSPCCLVNDEHAPSPQMVEMMKRMGQEVPEVERILELNGSHPLIQKLNALHERDDKDTRLPEHLALLRDQALLAEGGRIEDPAGFARRVQQMMAMVLG